MTTFMDPFAKKPEPVLSPEDVRLARIEAALLQLAAAVLDRPLPELPAPVVNVPPPDMSELVAAVNAVQALKGPATAEEIAAALRDVLAPERRGEDESTADLLKKLVEALEKLDFRLKGVNRGGGGGGGTATLTANGRPVSSDNPLPTTATGGAGGGLTNAELRASAVPVTLSGETITMPAAVEITNDAGNPLPVSGTVTATGPLTDAELRATPLPVSGTVTVNEPVTVDGTVALDAATLSALESVTVVDGGGSLTVDGTFWQATQPVSGTVAATQSGTWTVQPGNTANSTPWLTKPARGTTTTHTNPGDSTTSATLLASNTDRINAVITNLSSAVMYVKQGATASATSFTWRLEQNEAVVIDDYTGQVDAIWASDAGLTAMVAETT